MRRQIISVLASLVTVGGCAPAYVSPPPTASSSPKLISMEPVDPPEPRQVADVAPASAPASAPAIAPLEAAVRDVRDARDMDAAVDAYTRGLSTDSASIALHKAYLRKVVDLDVPQLGRTAAERVLAAEPNHGLARAVLAFSEGRQGQMVDALTDIALAARRAPTEPFVQRTAGHLLAWYDNNPYAPNLPPNVRRSLQDVHAALGTSPAFADAYRDASNYYREERQFAAGATTRPTTGPATAQDQLPEPPDVPAYGGYGTGYTAYTPSPYYEPYVVDHYYYYDYPYGCYPYCYYPYCWGPSFWFWPGFVFFDFDEFDHHRHHDRDRDRDADDRFRSRFFGDRSSSRGERGLTDARHLKELQQRVDPRSSFAARSFNHSTTPMSRSSSALPPTWGHSNGGMIYGHPDFVSRGSTGPHFAAPSFPSHSFRGGDGGGAPAPSHSGGSGEGGGGGSHSSGGGGGSHSGGGGGSRR